MIRHLSFKNPGELFAELVKQAPSSVYCSNAIYESPTLQMDEKGWKGAELDLRHRRRSIPTSCKARHTWWFCSNCHKGGMGTKPAKCPRLPGQTLEQVHWSCQGVPQCDQRAREAAGGLPSGRLRDRPRGHPAVLLGKQRVPCPRERREVRDRRPQDEDRDSQLHQGHGLNLKVQDRVTSHVELGWSRRTRPVPGKGDRGAPPSPKRTQKLTNQIIAANAALIDESVTTDIHRVFRMPGTLHGNSGLLKMRIASLEKFDPQRDPVVLGGETVTVRIYYSPEFFLERGQVRTLQSTRPSRYLFTQRYSFWQEGWARSN